MPGCLRSFPCCLPRMRGRAMVPGIAPDVLADPAVVLLLMIMPQQQQEKKRRAMIDG